jgi:RNA polymerase sigma-70 factor (ECF subfamily)
MSVLKGNKFDIFLVKNYLNGDEKSLEILISRYIKAVYNFSYQYVLNKSEAEDVTQETFLKVWKNLKKFDQNKNFKTWVFEIAKNTALDFLKKKNPIPFSEFETNSKNFVLENIRDEKISLNKQIDNSLLKEKLNQAINILPLKQKTVLLMHYKDELSLKKIAEILGENINTVKSRYSRALEELRKKLEFKNLN